MLSGTCKDRQTARTTSRVIHELYKSCSSGYTTGSGFTIKTDVS
jgi:hypothetical protein